MNTNISQELIAPCGMNCAVCSRYQAYITGLKRSGCKGCRTENRECSYLFKKCTGINSEIDGTRSAGFCYECDQFPCKSLKRMDKRYRINYAMSVIENLEFIHAHGIEKFSHDQANKYACPQCANLISVHNRKCFKCDVVTRLVEKYYS